MNERTGLRIKTDQFQPRWRRIVSHRLDNPFSTFEYGEWKVHDSDQFRSIAVPLIPNWHGRWFKSIIISVRMTLAVSIHQNARSHSFKPQ
jgi:hypothetical protein